MAGLDGEVLFVNEAGRKLLGIESEDALSLAMFHTEEGMKRAPILQKHGRWEGQGELRHFRTGALIPTQVSSFLVRDGAGNPLGFATVQRDLRDMRRLEEHMRQMQKMEAIGAARGGRRPRLQQHALGHPRATDRWSSEALPASSEMRAERRGDGERRPARGPAHPAAPRLQPAAGARARRSSSINEIVSGMERMARRLLREDIQLTTALDPAIGPVQGRRGPDGAGDPEPGRQRPRRDAGGRHADARHRSSVTVDRGRICRPVGRRRGATSRCA